MKAGAFPYPPYDVWERARVLSDQVPTAVNERIALHLHSMRTDHVVTCACQQCELLEALRAALI
jgi:hypothetical protein